MKRERAAGRKYCSGRGGPGFEREWRKQLLFHSEAWRKHPDRRSEVWSGHCHQRWEGLIKLTSHSKRARCTERS